ncbi:MAG: SusC/RagA family TonB-linked outer membrane protein, partial [Gemmatimonadaceae bacterium]
MATSFLLRPGPAAAQTATGTITGTVTDAASGQPIASVQVQVVGTTTGALTSTEGRYTLRNVRPGTVEVRALRVGFAETRGSAVVTAGQAATVDLRMRQIPAQLSPVVTTATGDQLREEVGTSIAQVDAANVVKTRPVANMADLLTARAAGVQVLPGNMTGAGARVRIRGTSSLSLSNNPIYIVDGVRVESSTGASSIGIGGTLPSRVNDLNPEEIESIEVVRGPSAATLYGTDAANGVIVIHTKRGVAGRPQWSYYTEQTAIQDRNDYPDSYRAWRTGTTAATTSTPANNVQCFLAQAAAGTCTQDSLTVFNLFKDSETTPYGTGYRQQHGLQLSGGSEMVRYFVSGEWENEDGVTQIPRFDLRRLNRQGVDILDEWRDPNALTKTTGRANVDISLPRNANMAVSVGYISQDQRLPQTDDNTTGLGSNAFGGLGYKWNTTPDGTDTLYGYRQYVPGDIFQETVTQSIERIISSLNTNWQPNAWLGLRGNFGLDYVNRVDKVLCRRGTCSDFSTSRLGFKEDNRTNYYVYTVDVAGTGTTQLSNTIGSKTTMGVQFTRNLFHRNGAWGEDLPAGFTTVTAGALQEADETTSESRTLGAFVEEHLAFNERFFLTGAVRSDRNSAFGADFKTVFYPKLQASWVVSRQGFFPQWGWVDELRLRSAYGASGVQPGTIDALAYFSATALKSEGSETPGVVFSALGNPDLKPERSTEFETGVDGTFWGSRVTAELTYYSKLSKDALVSRVLPPSIGTGENTRFENLGAVKNAGFEGLVSAQLVQRAAFGWDVTLNGSTNANKLVDLGNVPPIRGTSISQIEGYPINSYWERPIKYVIDKDQNGIITYNADTALSEISVGDTTEFIGYSIPRHEVTFTNGFEFFRRRARLAAMVDYKGGHKLYFNSERIRCDSRANCRGLLDPSAPFDEQAASVARRDDPRRTVAGFIHDADFIRLREVSLALTAPESWAERFLRGRSIGVTLAARNLGILW